MISMLSRDELDGSIAALRMEEASIRAYQNDLDAELSCSHRLRDSIAHVRYSFAHSCVVIWLQQY